MSDTTDKNDLTANSSELDLTTMTREEALSYLGLSSDADIKEIDDRFWQMAKKYRGKDDPESKKMDEEIATVYDIASGRRDFRVEHEQQIEAEPKIFGKSKSAWKTYIEYTWYKYLAGLVIGIAAIVVIVGLINNSRTSYAVVVFGHMMFDNTYMRETLVENGAKNPYVGYADVVVPNDEGFAYSETGNETLNAMFYMNPVALVSDKESYLYYYTVFKDLTPISDQIMAGLTDDAKAGIEPVYMSEREAIYYQNEMYRENGFDDMDLPNPEDFSDEPILIGYEITDPEAAAKMGVNCMWHSRQTTLIVGQCINCEEDEKSVLVITAIINSAYV